MSLRRKYWEWWYSSRIFKTSRLIQRLAATSKFVLFPTEAAKKFPILTRIQIRTDYRFAIQQADLETVRQREKLRRQGVGPLDPRYPDILKILRSWGWDTDCDLESIKRELRRITGMA